VGTPAITAVLARPLGGRLADAIGPRPVVACGSLLMCLGALPAFSHDYGALIASRLLVGAGEGAMMSASVLWLLRLAGPRRQGRALGHIGLANYGGLTLGPLLADVLGGTGRPDRVFAAAAVLPIGGLLLAMVARLGPAPDENGAERISLLHIARLVLRPGLGLLLVNIGYAALITFGPDALGRGAAIAVLPVYAGVVILVRTLGAGLPDRHGGTRTLTVAAPLAAAGLLMAAFLPVGPALAGVAVLGLGQARAVPALGLLALERVPAELHGAAAGTFFAWFDGGVGLGGPVAGAAAGIGGASGALAVAAAAVLLSRGAATGWRHA
jgi:predicted MFS family arabinose efflux permease